MTGSLPRSARTGRTALILAVGLAVAVAGWASATFFVEWFHFAVLAPKTQAAVEAAADLARLFGALVLSLFFAERSGGAQRSGERLLWVAGGLLVLGLGGLGFGYVEELISGVSDLNAAAYEALVIWTVAGALFAVGLVPRAPPRFGPGRLAATLIVFGILGLVVDEGVSALPPLALVTSPEAAVALGGDLPGTTAWHWVLSSVPLCLAVAAALGAASGHGRGTVPGWLLLAMVLFAGAQLHNLFWPSAYSPVLATADVLRLAFAAVIVLGGILELRRAAERAALLAEEKERTRRLGELAALKADFTAMVAHELGGPLSAVRRLADVLDLGAADPELRAYAICEIRKETEALKVLVADVQAAATVERDDFEVEPRPAPLAGVLEDARTCAGVLPGDHPVGIFWSRPKSHEEYRQDAWGVQKTPTPEREAFKECTGSAFTGTMVRADAGRIGQVLYNLLSNAAKHSPDGTPIELRVVGGNCRIRVEVDDHGSGIHPDDRCRIFEKFGRGRDAEGRKVSGMGLGLYISRRILLGHGSELSVCSTPGKGSVFSFELEVVETKGEDEVR